jgi:hypothetical protein
VNNEMKNSKNKINDNERKSNNIFISEEEEWENMTTVERYIESSKLWKIYLSFGGSLDPEPDSQSPFDFPEMQRAVPVDGRSGVYIIRRGGI